MSTLRSGILWLAFVASPALAAPPACPAWLQHTLPRLQDEQPVDLCRYAGRVLLVVNTASQCGYTPQYRTLEALHRRFGPRGLVVLGFPSNDFGRQEPGSNAAVADFCQNQFDVRFPMFAKSMVRADGPERNPLYAALAARTGESPGWNFHKYLVSRDGQAVTSFASAVDPQDPALVTAIERLLAKQ
jgi:glutathione peroxidase